MNTENKGKKRLLLRTIAAILALVMVYSVVNSQGDLLPRIVRAFAEDDPLSRIYSLLQGQIEDPKTYDEYYELATIAIGKGEYDAALSHLDDCEKLADPNDAVQMADLMLKRASLYVLMREYASALPVLARALAFDPQSAQALLLRAQISLEQKEYAAAAHDLQAYLVISPSDNTIRSTLAQVYETLGQYKDASLCYELLRAGLPDDDSHRLNSLRCLFLAGDYEEALQGFDEYLVKYQETEEDSADGVAEQAPAEIAPDALAATAYFLRAACKMQLTRYGDAVADYARAIQFGYTESLCLEQMVTCAYASEDYGNAIKYGEMLLAVDNTAALDALYQRMGAAAVSLERYEDAVRYLTSSVEANPDLTGSYYYRGVSLLSLGRAQEAADDFTASIDQGYLTQFCYYNRGVCYIQLLDYEKALDDMEKTLISGDEQSLKDAAKDILWQLAQYYENQKNSAADGIEADQITE